MKKSIVIVLLLLLAGYTINSVLFNGPTEYYLCSDRSFKIESGSVFYENSEGSWVKTKSEVYEDKIILPGWQMTLCEEKCSAKYVISRLAHNNLVRVKLLTADKQCRNKNSCSKYNTTREESKKYRSIGYVLSEKACLFKTK